jgi:hypothetical protein
MARNSSYIKKLKAEKKKKKKLEKEQKKIERQKNSSGGDLENMMAYVDEFGNISDTPPEIKKESDSESKTNQ